MKRKLIHIIDAAFGGFVVLAILTGVGITFGVSRGTYAKYERQFDAEVAELKKQLPTLPKDVYIDNEYVTYDDNKEFISVYKSEYENVRTIKVSEAEIATFGGIPKLEFYDTTSHMGKSLGAVDTAGGGIITFTINMEDYGDGDIDIVMSSANYDETIAGNTPMRRLSQYIDVKFDNMAVDMSFIDLPCSDKGKWFEFQHVILKDLHFKKGKNTLVLATKDNVESIRMPNLSHIHVFSEKASEQELSVNGDTMILVEQDNKTYLEFSGIAIGYKANQLAMDLCFDADPVNQIPSGALNVTVQDGMFLMKLDLSQLPTGKMYSHFWLNGEIYNTGREQGDIMTRLFYDQYNDWDNPTVLQELNGIQLVARAAMMSIFK